MANTVTILSYTNTFGDLLAQQNKAAVEINNIGANNYTKETGTLFLAGSGTGLSVTNTAILGTGVVSGTLSLLGTATSSNTVYINGLNYALNVANNAIIAKTLITDNFTANTMVRTGTINASGTAFVNGITANTIIRSQILNASGAGFVDNFTSNTLIRTGSINASGAAFVDNFTANTMIRTGTINASGTSFVNGITANTIIRTQTLNASSLGVFENVVANTNITTQNLLVNGTATITSGSFTGQATITSGSFTGQATLTGTSTAVTPNTNTANTQIATTAWVKDVLNSGNTFNISASNPYVVTMNQGVNTANSVQFSSLGIGTAASGTSGEIRATNNITAYYSDDRLKTRLGNIENALTKVMSLNGFQYEANETAQALGYTVKPEIGLSAQEVQAVLPEVVVPAPIDEKYLTIHYERVIPLLVEAIKELSREIDELKKK
jgi:hypothetical protein